jgi:hypothetical protein
VFLVFFVPTVFLAVATAYSADDDTQEWTTATIKNDIDDRWTLSLESRVRFDDDVSRAKDLLVGPAVELHLSETFSLGAGYDYVYSFVTDKTSENRIWEQANLKFARAGLTVENRLRVEQRFLDDVSGAVVRLRYRLRLAHPLGLLDWNAIAWDEVFVNLNSQPGHASGFEQNRLFGGVGIPLLNDLLLETGYQWGYQEKQSGPNEVMHTLLVNLTYSF